eukprot:7188488-Pyramimonas_sp.AAC.1
MPVGDDKDGGAFENWARSPGALLYAICKKSGAVQVIGAPPIASPPMLFSCTLEANSLFRWYIAMRSSREKAKAGV